MATNYNITQKQYNGTDYDTLYPKNTSQQVLLNDSALATALGLSGTPTVNDVLNAFSSQDVRVVFGSYSGLGTVGVNNPNTVSISGAGTLQAFLIGVSNSGGNLICGGNLWIKNAPPIIATSLSSGGGIASVEATVTWGTQSISWYVSSDYYTAAYQCNTSNTTYYYMAILTR